MKTSSKKATAPIAAAREMPEARTQIEMRAYHLWLADGGRHGSALDYWLQAERELSPGTRSNSQQESMRQNSRWQSSARSR